MFTHAHHLKRILLSIVLALAGMLYPFAATAATWDLTVDDTIAGFGVEITVEGPSSMDFDVTIVPPQGKDIVLSGRTDNRGEAVIEVDPEETERAGTYEVTLENADATFEVFPGAPASFFLDTDDGEEPRAREESILLAGIEDEYGNPISGRPLLLLADDGEVTKIDDETDEDGIARFTFTASSTGEVTFTLVDVLSEETEEFTFAVLSSSGKKSSGGSKLGASLLDEFKKEDKEAEEEDYGFVDHFGIEAAEHTVSINEPFDISIIALDRNDKRVEDFTGRVVLTTTDPDGQVPRTAVKFFASDRGRVSLPLSITFGTPGAHTLRAYDEADRDTEGAQEFRVFGGNAPLDQGHIVITHPSTSPSTVGAGPVSIAVHAPAYINLILYDNGETKATTASNEEGEATFSLTLNPAVATHVIYVAEGEGGLDRKSSTVTLTIDATMPQIKSILLLPEKVKVGGSVTLSVTAEAGHTVMSSLAGGEEIALAEGEAAEGGFSVYQASFTAPAAPGNYAVLVSVQDAAGNIVKETKNLTVDAGGLPAVSALTAIARDRDIELQWTPVPEASSYRIYFGITPADLGQHIDTHSSASSARLTGLNGGQMYYVSVTALSSDNRESESRSPLASAQTLGSLFQTRLTSLVNGALMEWVAPPSADIIAYRIQYGVQAGVYTEQRVLPPGTTRMEIPDLINGVSYYVSLAALLRDGQLLLDTADSAVTPGEGGRPHMRLAPSDPLPSDLLLGSAPPSSGTAPRNAPPSTPRSGLPLTLILSLSFLLGGRYLLRSSRKWLTSVHFREHTDSPPPSACPPRIQW